MEYKKNVKILDSTLREGEQQAGVRFSAQDKIIIMKMLEDFGVDIIEVGHPGISEEDERICTEVARHASKAEILMHSRANIEEVKAVKRAGADWVGIWASVNDISLANKFSNKSIEFVSSIVKDSIKEAKKLGLKVRFTIEDASRTDLNDIDNIVEIALESGADCISIADTVGILEPKTCSNLVTYLKRKFNCQVEIHLHNDLGLSVANALAALDSGVDIIDTSVLGIGERAGITNLIELSVILNQLRDDKRFNLKLIPKLSQVVSTATGYYPDELRPIVGRNSFTHTAPYHVKAVKKDPSTYEAFPPSLVNRERRIIKERAKLKKPKLPVSLEVGVPFVKGASELMYHRDGPGIRWVLLDSRIDERSSFYVIQRFFNDSNTNNKEKHVDKHIHNCDSAFIFWGHEEDGTGLTCCVQVGDQEKIVYSPATIFIPAYTEHSYYYISGKGKFINIVLSPEYNESLTKKPLKIKFDNFNEEGVVIYEDFVSS
ncbi:LeuA family protein [Parageobacillus thermoglucosidasius]|jgi:isopropylmalate/homocitrate/citramalate synthase|uniref:2-isopropylmalate synthase n=1 Tax=Parageobacillus thermoglucosidasius TaxID=1426 RepID=A0A1B7KVL1_PARTM|nr:2-isopropylmalate synthase [Parageobacillus thermoglucosidasius]OAT74103.1 2-isopropylmalate synthase [Parageobacillus thermoglucosidasius]